MIDAERMDGGADASGISLAAFLPDARFVGCDDIVAARCTADVRRVRSGDVFVARLTAAGDGHERVADAVARGAVAVVAERMIPTHGLPLCIVPDSAWAQARLAQACAGDPADHLQLIAVAGTSGKTTTSWLAAAVLAEAGLRVGVLSDLGCLDAEGTSPEPADLAQPEVFAAWLRRLAASGCTHAVVEVSSRMLAEHTLAGVTCATAVVTSCAAARLHEHGTASAYRAILGRIRDVLAPDGCLIFNADDPQARRLAGRHRGPTLAVGLRAPAAVTAMPVERSLHGQTVLVTAAGHTAAATLSTPTATFARDALFATAVALRHRVPLERVTRGLEAAGGVPGRLERIDRGQEAVVFVDHAAGGHALATTLGSLRRLTPGRLLLVADEEEAARLGPLTTFAARAARWCDAALVVPETVLDDRADGEAVAAYARLDRLLAQAGRGDCVVVLGGLATLVDGWLQLAHPPMRGGQRVA